MLEKYFNRKFKTLRGVKFAMFLKRPYDWIKLKLRGEKIIQQNYAIDGTSINFGKSYYRIMNLILTESMKTDFAKEFKRDITAEIEKHLVEELKKDGERNKL
ncbi:MAG TPA: hypothetical protein VLB82_06055 [Thermodesulfobacteriota bacterium]|nr:hypothetical protein [Thermodesulfobacteriota bacterium]